MENFCNPIVFACVYTVFYVYKTGFYRQRPCRMRTPAITNCKPTHLLRKPFTYLKTIWVWRLDFHNVKHRLRLLPLLNQQLHYVQVVLERLHVRFSVVVVQLQWTEQKKAKRINFWWVVVFHQWKQKKKEEQNVKAQATIGGQTVWSGKVWGKNWIVSFSLAQKILENEYANNEYRYRNNIRKNWTLFSLTFLLSILKIQIEDQRSGHYYNARIKMRCDRLHMKIENRNDQLCLHQWFKQSQQNLK